MISLGFYCTKTNWILVRNSPFCRHVLFWHMVSYCDCLTSLGSNVFLTGNTDLTYITYVKLPLSSYCIFREVMAVIVLMGDITPIKVYKLF
jgi:hypothetical protein